MAENPMLPLWTDALLGDTQHLSTAEFGAYMLMLVVAWRSPDCALPNDDKYLARITRTGGASWRQIKKEVMKFWHLEEDGKWHQKRLKKESARVQDLRDQRRAAGKASALKKQRSDSTSVARPLQRSLNERSNTHTQTQKETPLPRGSLGPGDDDDAALIKSADQLRERLERKLSLGLPVIRAPIVGWLQNGASVALIEATIDDVLSHKPPGWKPDGIAYFSRSIMRAVASNAPTGLAAKPSGGYEAEVETVDQRRAAQRHLLQQRAAIIAKGRNLPNVTQLDVRQMIDEGLLTEEQARKAGYV